MSMLSFMPWCRIDKTYVVGEIQILPFDTHKPIESLDAAAQCLVNTILASYRTIEGESVDRAALIWYGMKSLTDDLNEEERENVRELMSLASFSGLAGREYFNSLGPYCNSDCFALYIQKFEKADFVCITTRRRDGETMSGWPIDDIAITVPVHCHTVRELSVDESLLKSLGALRTQSKSEEWARWQNAVSCFNQANTDNESVRHQVEWLLMCSAFEHILNANSEAKDVARKFADVFLPREPVKIENSKRRSTSWGNPDEHLRFEWMKEFYRIRGDFAHGKLVTRQPTAWNELEHLVLAAIAFPLMVRCLLQRTGHYSLTDNDIAQINCFERLADEKFLEDPSDQRHSGDSVWSRLISEERWSLVTEKSFASLEAKDFFGESTEGSIAGPA